MSTYSTRFPSSTLRSHHRHYIKHNRKPTPGISFQTPNLPTLIADCITLGEALVNP